MAHSAALDPATQSSAELVAPLVDGARAVDDDAGPRHARHLVADDEVRLASTKPRTAAAEVGQRDPDRLVAASAQLGLLALLEHVQHADAESHPLADLLA